MGVAPTRRLRHGREPDGGLFSAGAKKFWMIALLEIKVYIKRELKEI
jgi:hypothetical protein